MPICDICACRITEKKPKVTNHPLYNVFKGMRARCYYKKDKNFKRYGGKGVFIYKEWLENPKSFINWAISNDWKKGLHIDRIDNSGGYEPSNCRIVTNAQNQRNKTNHVFLTYKGTVYMLSDLSKKFDMRPSTLWCRLNKYGMELNQALEKPVKKRDESYRYKNKIIS